MAAIPFKTRNNRNARSFTPSGSKMANTYEIQIDANGHKTLVKTGEENVYVLIQSELEETKIENIIAKVTMGDTTALEQRQGQFIDTTDMPKTLAEAQNMIIKITNQFEGLSTEEKAKFDYSPEKFISEYGTQEWAEKMNLIEKVTEKIELPKDKIELNKDLVKETINE